MQQLWKTVPKFLKKLKIELPYDPAIPLLGIYPKELKAGCGRPVFPEAQFTIVNRWKQPKRPLMKESINRMCHSLTMEYYSALQRKKILSHAKKWMSFLTHYSFFSPSNASCKLLKRIFWSGASLVAQTVKNLPAMWETGVRYLGWEDPLEKGMVPHSSTLAWIIPWTEEPGGLQSIESQRVGQHWAANGLLSLWSCGFQV